MKKTEKILVIISVIFLLLNLFLIFPGGNVLFILAFSFLSLLYFFFGFALFTGLRLRNILKKENYSDISALKILGAVGTGISLSITVIAILFKIMFWPGSKVNMIVGICSLLIIIIIAFIKKSNSSEEYYKLILKRSCLFGVIALILISISNQTLAEIKFRNEPDYAKALINVMNNPNDTNAQEVYNRESKKRELQ